jgi:AcrR family transcriptional regulator
MPKVSEAHLASRHAQILRAAIACFARNGFHRTTINDIAAEAGLSPGAIYKYFASKDEVIEAISVERHRREREWLKEATKATNPRGAILALAHSFIGGLSEGDTALDRRVGILMWSEALRNPRIRRLVREGVDEPLSVFRDLVADAQQQGQIGRDFDPEVVARMMIALFQGFVLQRAWDPQADIEQYLNGVEQLLRAVSETQ